MAEKRFTPIHAPIDGAIDLMYFPPAQRASGVDGNEPRCHERIEPVVRLKQECGLAYVFVTQCKRWSCDRRIYCEDTHLDDVLRYTQPYPQHFIGIAAYNPLEIGTSTHDAEVGIKHHGFRGIHVHPGSFGVGLSDRRMYPLYAKASEWKAPVILDVRALVREDCSSRSAEVEQIASDFPDLSFVIAQALWSAAEMLRLTDNLANMFFCFDTAALLRKDARDFIHTSGATRCMWGSNGVAWKEALDDIPPLEQKTVRLLMWENAIQIFGLDHLRKRRAKPFVETQDPLVRIVAE